MAENRPALAEPVVRNKRGIEELLRDSRTKNGIATVAAKLIDPDRLLRLSVNAIRRTPNLKLCDPQSVLGAIMTTASLGLEPNTPLGHAYLIPYKNSRWDPATRQRVEWYECQFQIGYKGFIVLAHRSPKLLQLEAEAIHENDFFEHQKGSESFLRYRKTLADRGEMQGAFCYMRTRSEFGHEGQMATVLPLEEVLKIRARSETYRSLVRRVEEADTDRKREAAERKLAETPWVMWEDDMAAKSAIKKACKQFPLTPQMVAAADADSAADEGVLDLSAMADPELARAFAEGETDAPVIEGDDEIDEKPERPIVVNTQTEKDDGRGSGEKEVGGPAADQGRDAKADPVSQQPEGVDARDGEHLGPGPGDGDLAGGEHRVDPPPADRGGHRASGGGTRKGQANRAEPRDASEAAPVGPIPGELEFGE